MSKNSGGARFQDPDHPDSLTPSRNAERPSEWLGAALERLHTLCAAEDEVRWNTVDMQVIHALKLAREIRENEELQAAWCSAEAWNLVKHKRPKLGVTTKTEEEVFRYVWALCRGDQDGYELRWKAVRKCPKDTSEPDEIVAWIRGNGGYVAVSRSPGPGAPRSLDQSSQTLTKSKLQPCKANEKSERNIPRTDPEPSTEVIACLVHFVECHVEAMASNKEALSCMITLDLDADPPHVFVHSAF